MQLESWKQENTQHCKKAVFWIQVCIVLYCTGLGMRKEINTLQHTVLYLLSPLLYWWKETNDMPRKRLRFEKKKSETVNSRDILALENQLQYIIVIPQKG